MIKDLFYEQADFLISILPYMTKDMPAVKWKLVNLKKMNAIKHRKAVDELRKVLENS